MKKTILLMMLLTGFLYNAANAQKTHEIHIHNSYCNGYYVIFYAADNQCGAVTAQSDPIFMDANAMSKHIEFTGTTVTMGSGTFKWASSTPPGTPNWYMVGAYVYNACGVTPGTGCMYPYDEVTLNCPNDFGQYEISSTCAFTNPSCDICPNNGAYVQSVGFDYDNSWGYELYILNGH